MAKSIRKMLITAKIEAVSGTDSNPTPSLNAILAKSINPQPIVAEFIDRGIVRPYFGNSQVLPAGVHSRVEFEVELQGSGSAGTAPAWGPLLRGCAFEEITPTAGTSVEYRPISEDFETLTLYVYMDELRFKMTGCLGTVAFDFTSKAVPVMRFAFIGIQDDMTDVVMPIDTDYSDFLDPKTVSRVNTPTITLHGVSNCVQSLTCDMQNQLIWRDLMGCGGAHISNRTPNGQLVMEMTKVSDKNWMQIIKNGSLDAINLVHGSVAGYIVEVAAPKTQFTNPQFTDQDGILMLSTGVSFNPNAGNDEFVLIAR
ncbi:MAG: phage tail tube protein [Lautropia sp.]